MISNTDPIDAGLVTAQKGDFALSRLSSQLRERWEIGPLSDLFIVYNRGRNLPSRVDESFADLFDDALREPVIDMFVVKLRYRFGN